MKHIILHYAVCAALSVISVSAFASEHPDSIEHEICLDELSVTAIKQGSQLDYQAVSATSIARREIESLQISDAKAASNLVPNFFMPDYGSRITSSIYVRGLGARIDQPAVGLNIDNVPIMNKDNYDFDLPDIDRIEMLRGSQSTLFGRNTMGGLINIYTLSPMAFQGFRASAGYASGNTFKAAASFYAKPHNRLGLSLTAFYRSVGGFFTNAFNGEKCDHEKQVGGRTKLQWRPSSIVSIDNVLSLSLVRQGGYPYELVNQAISNLPDDEHKISRYNVGEISYNDTCFYRRTSVCDGLTVSADLGGARLSSITSYQFIDDNMTLDQDFLPASYFTLTQAKCEHTVTQDFIAKSTSLSKYAWLAGLFGFYKSCHMDAPVTFLDDGIHQLIENKYNANFSDNKIYWDSRRFILGSNFKTSSYGLAFYHQSSLHIGRLNLLAGVRFDYEHTALDYLSECSTGYTARRTADGSTLAHVDVNINDPGSLSQSFFEVIPKLSVTYDVPSAIKARIYASAAKGYKAGGFNTQMFSDVLQQRIMNTMGVGSSYNVDEIITYKPEHSWTFEAGTHAEWLDSRLHTDLSVFYIHCTDQQLTVFPDGNTTGRIMTNAGKTRSWGIELSLKANPMQNLDLAMSFGFTDARFIDFYDGKEDFSGKFIPYAPQNTIFASANYRFDVNKGPFKHIDIGVNTRTAGKIYWNEQNNVHQNLYALLGATVSFAGSNFALDFWGENLTDTNYKTFYFMSINNTFLQRGKPLQIGATLKINI